MPKTSSLRRLAALALALAAGAASAAFDPVNDDTDIFLANPSFTATRPNVLIFIDNTANWGQSAGGVTKFQGVRAALTSVLNGVVTDAYNVGVSLFVETGNPNNSVSGAYIRYGIRQMTGDNKSQLVTMINALDQTGDRGNAARYSLAMSEIFNYWAGRSSHSGHGKIKSDAGGSIYSTSGRITLAGSPLAAGALPDNGGTAQAYVSPITDACQKNFQIIVSNGEANDNTASIDEATTLYTQQTGTAPGTIALNPSGSEGIIADEYARYMANSDCNPNIAGVQNVYTYAIDVLPGTTGQGPAHTALLKSMATNGKGKYYAITDISNTSQLEAAFTQIFTEVQAVNSVFASTTLPVSVNVRGTNLNQVYIGVFRPDPNKSPKWLGNLKLYKLGVDTATDTLFLADANGDPAENAATGFVSANASSFWTTSSSYWAFRDAAVNGTGGSSDLPDGDLVEKGGAAQRLRLAFPGPLSTSPDHTARNLYTCLDTTSTGPCATTGLSSTLFNTTNVPAGDIGAFTTKGVVNLTSAGTTATATVTAHGWSSGDTVRVQGSTPNNYNGDFSITVVDANTFTYTMASAPDATRARMTAANHQLVPGDLACVNATPSGFNACWTPITRIDANNVDYTPTTPQSTAATAFGTTWGGRQVPFVVGIPGGIPAGTAGLPAVGFPNTVAKMVLQSHGYGAAGTTYDNSYLLPQFAVPMPFWFANFVTSTVMDANTIHIPVASPPVSGTINAAHVISQNHGFSTGQTVSISGSLIAGHNGNKVITKIDDNTFTFTSTVTTADTSGGIRAGHSITSITHPTTGPAANRDTATVTTVTAHGLTAGQTITILGTGAFPGTGYDANWVVQSTPTTTTFTIFNAAIDALATPNNPAAGVVGKSILRIDPAITDSQAGIIHWKTLTPTAINPLVTASGTITAGRPTDGDTAVRDAVVNWVRGQDNLAPDENANGVLTDVRASVHGDVLHSRPATINYNRYGDDNDIYAFYGSNDGILHAVKGGITAHTSGPDVALVPGTERWGFIPKEFFGRLKRLRDQSPQISSTNQKDYFFDGSIGVYQKDVAGSGSAAAPGAGTVTGVIGDNAADKVHIYLSLRRGGDFIYALDVTNPANPKLLWKKGSGDTGWGALGQTWSEPKVARVNASLGNVSNPDNVVLVFGAGYDDALEDINPCLLNAWTTASVTQKAIGTGTVTYTSAGSCTIAGATGGTTTFNRTKGRGILVVDAFNGNVVWQAGVAPTGAANNLTVTSMSCAIPSDVTVLDKNRDGFADRLYVGDTCGNVWRADITSANIANWAVTRVASLSGTDSAVITDKRKFMYPPDLVFGADADGNYTAVLLGSGDREHPFDTTVQNAFYMIKDRDDSNPANPSVGAPNSSTTSIATPASTATNVPITDAVLFDATNLVVDNAQASSLNGWKLNLAAGEKSVGSAVTIAGTTFFNTNQPSATAGGGSCGSNLGIAREYLVGFADAAATVDLLGTGTLSIANRSSVRAGGGYLPSPVPVVVELNNKKYQAVISGTSVRQPPGTTLDARLRTYWYKEID